MTVPEAQAEQARTVLVELFPDGFEESVPPGTGGWVAASAWADTGGAAGVAPLTPGDPVVEFAAYYADADAEAALRAAGLGPVTVTEIEDGWEDRWREFHHAAVVGGLWVGPPWEATAADPALIRLVIDPGRAFGTGAHPTTRLCLELLQGERPGSTLDIGCGSGVLSVAAALLGHGPSLGIDDDPLAIEVTAENAAANGVAAQVTARLSDAREGALPAADLAFANISLAVVESVLPRLASRRAIVSGFLERDTPAAPGWRCVERCTLDGWAAELLERDEA